MLLNLREDRAPQSSHLTVTVPAGGPLAPGQTV